jgi:hypothetical protein
MVVRLERARGLARCVRSEGLAPPPREMDVFSFTPRSFCLREKIGGEGPRASLNAVEKN